MRGLFITGTDTGIGKTVACVALLHRFCGEASLGYWKPIQTGMDQDDDTAEVRRLADSNGAEIFDKGIRLAHPVSPHLAAQMENRRIELADLRAMQPLDNRAWIVEGGGALVPINENELMVDWMVMLQLPVVIVARSTLGTINHTLLTLEALRQRRLTIAGVMIMGEKNPANRAAIEHYGNVRVLGEMPRIAPLNSSALAQWSRANLDTAGSLLEFLR